MPETPQSNHERYLAVLRLNFVLAFLEGVWVLWQYLRQPSETGSALFLGFSLVRWVFLACVLFSLGMLLFLLRGSLRETWLNSRTGTFFKNAVERTATIRLVLLWAGLSYVSLFISEQYLDPYTAYRDRLNPLLRWSVILAIQALLSLFYVRSVGVNLASEYGDVLLPALIALILLGLFIGFVAITGLGLMPDAIYWQSAGTPILLIQVLFAWICGSILYALVARARLLRSARLDLFISAGLWALAFLLWMSQSARPSYNSLEPSAPNFQSYPFGDSIIYDIAAHEYLIGTPIPSEFGAKPLYSLFLAILHLFSGEDYALLVMLQVAVMAVIPVLVYLLTSHLADRTAAFVAAVLVILREKNGIALSNVIEVSHVKLLMSDIFAMGLMIFSLWLFYRWADKPQDRRPTLVALGGAISLLSLMRGHPILLIPLMVCMILLVFSIPLRLRLHCALLFTMGAALPMIPWFWRNYEMTGEFTFQDPVSRYTTHMAGLYSLSLEAPLRLDGEADVEYYRRLRGQPLEFILHHPGEVAKFVSAHQFHNMILSYVYLPHSFRIESLRSHVKAEPFWSEWKGELGAQGWLLLLLNFGLIALGIGSAWRKQRILALAPIIFGTGYILSVSIGRLSGWRFIQPADWITLVYYSIGLMQISSIARFVLLRAPREVEFEASSEWQANTQERKWAGGGAAVSLFLLCVALALTHGHQLFSSRFPSKSRVELLDEYRQWTGSLAPQHTEVARFLQADDAVILYGEAIYPAFFEADRGAYNHYLLSYQAKPYSRVVFYLLGPQSAGVVLPLISAPSSFPDGAAVIVVGCKDETGVVEAVFTLVAEDGIVLYTSEPFAGYSCPLSAAE